MAKGGKTDAGVVRLVNVSVEREGRRILRSVNLSVERGQHWVIAGPNGSGKTTLLNVINAYLWPTRGRVSVLGERYGEVDVRDMRRLIGFVTSALYERVPPRETCLEVVLSGRFASLGMYEEPSSEDRLLAENNARFMGLENVLDRRYGVLSFGERQRTLIARALTAGPRLLILDEPFEGLDLGARERVMSFLEALLSREDSPSVLLVTHRIEEIPSGITHAALLKDGRILAAGPREVVLTSDNLSRAMDCTVKVLHRNGRMAALVG
jgi:iron complex transport system ATP-binding protein